MGQHRRKIKNISLNPAFQLQYGLYLTTASVVGSMVLVGAFVIRVLTQMTIWMDGPEERGLVALQAVRSSATALFVGLLILFIISIVITFVYSHRILGPIMKFEKHIDQMLEGNFSNKIVLRDKDHFHGLASKLNLLNERCAAANQSADTNHRRS